jgi:hypothetical protein
MRYLHLRFPIDCQSDIINLIPEFNSLSDFRILYTTDGSKILYLLFENQIFEVQSNNKTISIYGPTPNEEPNIFFKYLVRNIEHPQEDTEIFYIKERSCI